MKIVFYFLLLLCPFSHFAQQSIDLFTLSGRYALPQDYNPKLANKATETGMLLNAKLPVVFSKKTIWYNNFTYTYAGVQNQLDLAPTLMNPIKLNAFILQTGLVQRIDDKNAFQLLFVPRFMTDFVAPTAKSWQFGAIGLFEHKYSEKLTLRYGAIYNQELGGPLLVPLVDINWQINAKWSIVGLFPIYLKANYHINEKLTVGFSHFGLITSYYLTDPNYLGDYMERTSIDLTLFCRRKLVGNLFIEGRVGMALSRAYEQYHADQKVDFRISIIKIGDNRGAPLNPVFNDGLIANLRLVYNLPLE